MIDNDFDIFGPGVRLIKYIVEFFLITYFIRSAFSVDYHLFKDYGPAMWIITYMMLSILIRFCLAMFGLYSLNELTGMVGALFFTLFIVLCYNVYTGNQALDRRPMCPERKAYIEERDARKDAERATMIYIRDFIDYQEGRRLSF